MKFATASLALLCAPVSAKTYFKESFNDASWKTRWSAPTGWKPALEMGAWETSAGEWHSGDESDKALRTSQDARFYGLSVPLDSPFSNMETDLVVQYTVKHEQKLDCGGAYIKLLPGGSSFDADAFSGDTEYAVMFGPDICGSSTRRTHVILNHDGSNHLIEKDVKCETDQLSHLYTLHIMAATGTFDVMVDGKSVRTGTIEDEFKMLLPRDIKDPSLSKPADWVDEAQIPDPQAVKPEGHDDISPEIPDPTAVKPEDWDEEDDGEWEPAFITNPDYTGTWKPKMVANPDYKGLWEHPTVANPDYKKDENLHARCSEANPCTHIGFELWQVTSGTSFDDIIVTDDINEANEFAEKTFYKKVDKEKTMYKDVMEKEREERDRKNEAERIRREAEEEALGGDEMEEEVFDEL